MKPISINGISSKTIFLNCRKSLKNYYKFDYNELWKEKFFNASKLEEQIAWLRWMFTNDLFFMVYYGLNRVDINTFDTPFILQACRELEEGPPTDTVDLWSRGHYKLLSDDTPMLTPDGWTTHGELKPGDFVFAPSGKPVRVLATTGSQYDPEMYNIYFKKQGKIMVESMLCAGSQHLWDVGFFDFNSKWQERILSTKDIINNPNHWYTIHGGRGHWYFNNIEKTKTVSGQCIQVEGGRYVAGEHLIPTHNSSLITQGKTMQDLMKYDDLSVGIFSHTRPIAKSFLLPIKIAFEDNILLKFAFPDKLWELPKKDAKIWSLDEGLELKRASASNTRSLEAWGLVDGMPQALDINTPVLTTKGWKKHGNLEVGDFVYDEYHKPVEVIFNTGEILNGNCYKIKFRDTEIIAEENHLWPASGTLVKTKDLLVDKVHVLSLDKIESCPVNCIQVKSLTGLYLAGESLVPTHNSKHYNIRVYDDVITEKTATTPDMIKKAEDAFRMSDNLGTLTGINWQRIVGTIYNYGDFYCTIIDEMRNGIYPWNVRKFVWWDGVYTEEDIAKEQITQDYINVFGYKKPRLMTWKSTLDKYKKQSNFIWSCQMELNPTVDEAAEFNIEWFENRYRAVPSPVNLYILVDPANEKEKNSNYTVIALVGIDRFSNRLLIDLVRDKLDLGERWDAIKDMVVTCYDIGGNFMGVYYEKYGKDSDIWYFEQKQKEEGIYFALNSISGNKRRKNDRIRALIPIAREGKFLLPEKPIIYQNEDLVKTLLNREIRKFPFYMKNDDMLDAISRIEDPEVELTVPIDLNAYSGGIAGMMDEYYESVSCEEQI